MQNPLCIPPTNLLVRLRFPLRSSGDAGDGVGVVGVSVVSAAMAAEQEEQGEQGEQGELDEQEQLERDEMERQIRTSKALQTMERELLLPAASVMPVLLRLLKTFEGKWEHIEDENYRLLADMVFQQQEAAEAERAPGSSRGRKPAAGKKEKKATRNSTPRRAARNSKLRAETDDDDSEENVELIRRSKRVPVDAFTHAAGMASLERAVGARRSRATTPRRAAPPAVVDNDPASEPPLALLPAPPPHQCQEPQCQELRRELRRIQSGAQSSKSAMTGVEMQTQTEAADFDALNNQSSAIVWYEERIESAEIVEPIEPPTPIAMQQTTPQPLVVAKQENEAPVFLPAAQVRRQILGHVAPPPPPLKSLTCDVKCKKCEKPKPATTAVVPVVARDPSRSLVFDPCRVKIEGESARPGSSRTTDANPVPIMCLNPEPLQTVVPSLPLPLPLAGPFTESRVMELPPPEPLLLTFPEEAPANNGIAETSGVSEVPRPLQAPKCELPNVVVSSCSVPAPPCELPKVLVPCSVQAPCSVQGSICDLPSKVLVPSCSVKAPIEVLPLQGDANAGSSSERNGCTPAEVVRVECPLVKVEVEVGLPNKVEAEEVTLAESFIAKFEVPQQPTENSITDGALAALASYISESDEEEDVNISPKLEPRERRSVKVVEEGVEYGKLFPENLPDKSRDSGAVVDPPNLDNILPAFSRSAEDSEMNVPNPDTDAGQAHSDVARVDSSKQSSDTKSSESSKKRKRITNQEQHEQQPVEEKRKIRNDWDDISRGKEKVPIPLSAPPHGEGLPKDFYYINSSVVFQSAHVGISMARIGEDDRCSSCVGNCLDNPTPCECARTTDGEFAYTVEGSLYPAFLKQELERKADMKYLSFCQPGACPVERTNDEPCKGHIQRRFIKECWEKCGCSQLCGNRIVQRGIAHKLQVFWTDGGKGWGVRTLEYLPAGSFVCEYVGEILTNTEMWYRNNDVHRTAKHSFVLNIDADWNSEKILKDEEALCLDGTYYGNVSRFINHRCGDCNLFDIPVEIESPDHHYYHLAFFTSKELNENEELTWDYGLDFGDKDHQLQAFECFCGSSLCRGKVEAHGKP